MAPQPVVLVLDGLVAGAARKISGGVAKPTVVTPSTSRAFKTEPVTEIDPVSLEIGALAPVIEWFRSAMRKEHARRDVSMYHSTGGKLAFEFDGVRCLVTRATMPAVKRGSTESAFIGVALQPEYTASKTHQVAGRPLPTLQDVPALSGGEFKFVIDGIVAANEVQSVDAFSFKIGTVKNYTGDSKTPQIEAGRVDVPNITFTLSGPAQGLVDWQNKTMAGRRDAASRNTAWIEYYTRAKTAAFAVNLFEVELVSFTVMAGGTAKGEIACGAMDIDIRRR